MMLLRRAVLVIALAWAGLAALRRLRERLQARHIAAAAASSNISVGIIGAGVGGIATAKRCLDLGIPFHIYELAEDFGGTWLKNTYPGCGCDVPAHSYSFSWAMNPNFSCKFAKQPELLAYFQHVARNQLQLHQHASFHTRVNSASFGRDGKWTLHVQDVRNNGVVSVKEHAFLVSAVGQLNVPLIPANLDASNFKGALGTFHSAQWPKSGLDLTGKRVAVIGTGASAIQFVPELAKQCSEVHVFQRSKVHLFEKIDYPYSRALQLAFQYVPLALWAHRAFLFSYQELIYFMVVPGVTGNAFNKQLARDSVEHMTKTSRGENLAQLLPDAGQVLGCKRLLFSNTWCTLFASGGCCTLHSDAVTEITTRGVRTGEGGKEVEVDCIVFGTGFKSGSFLHGLQLEAWDDSLQRMVSLHDEVWDGEVQGDAYCGVTVKRMPNFAMCYGANSNLNHSSIISIIEAQVEHFIQLASHAITTTTGTSSSSSSFRLKDDAHAAYNVREQELLKDTVFSADCDSWYKRNAANKILNTYHGGLVEFWWSTSLVKWSDYEFK